MADVQRGRLERIIQVAAQLEAIGDWAGRLDRLRSELAGIEAQAQEVRALAADALADLGRASSSDSDDPVWVPDDPQSPSVDFVNNDES